MISLSFIFLPAQFLILLYFIMFYIYGCLHTEGPERDAFSIVCISRTVIDSTLTLITTLMTLPN